MPPINTQWTLRVFHGNATSEDREAFSGLSIGRHPDCDLTLNDSRVSARHAMIIERGSDLAIVDLGSNNGTCINGSRVLAKDEEQILIGGMRIQLGHVDLEVIAPSLDQTAVAGAEGEDLGDLTVSAAQGDSELNATTQWAPGTSKELLSENQETRIAPPAQPTERARPPAEPEPPKPKLPEPEAQKPVLPPPVADRSKDSFDAFDSMELNTIVADANNVIGAESKLISMDARLVVLNEADLRIVPLDSVEFTVGRSSEANLQLKNRGVSTIHARIVFVPAGNLFMLEDRGSANGTQISGAPLAANAPRELDPDSHIRFGTIEAVFMQSLDSDFHELPKGLHDIAAGLLKTRHKVSAAILKQATKEASERDQTLGEALLLGQHVTARDWCVAVRDARMTAVVDEISGGGSRRWWIYVLVLVLVAAAVLLGLPQGRELIGLSKP